MYSPRKIPTEAEMIAEFGQLFGVITTPPFGTITHISGGAVDGRIWCIDIDYRAGRQLVARVRTIRELSPPPIHGAPGDFLRSTLIEFSVNAELSTGRTAADSDRPLGMQISAHQEQLAAQSSPGRAEVVINGSTKAADTLHIPGYRAQSSRLGKAVLIYVGKDDMPFPELQMSSTPHA